MNYKSKMVHISTIQSGDTVKHNGYMRTVCSNNLKKSTFMGTTLWGDSYKIGSVLVEKYLTNSSGCLISIK